MTKPEDILRFIDRTGYDGACAEMGVQPLPDHEVAALAETGFERLCSLAVKGASLAVLATHLRRGWSVLSGRPQSYSGELL